MISYILAAAMATCSVTPDTLNMCANGEFYALKPLKVCTPHADLCKGEVSKMCASKKLKKVECRKQYGGVWMARCICE